MGRVVGLARLPPGWAVGSDSRAWLLAGRWVACGHRGAFPRLAGLAGVLCTESWLGWLGFGWVHTRLVTNHSPNTTTIIASPLVGPQLVLTIILIHPTKP